MPLRIFHKTAWCGTCPFVRFGTLRASGLFILPRSAVILFETELVASRLPVEPMLAIGASVVARITSRTDSTERYILSKWRRLDGTA